MDDQKGRLILNEIIMSSDKNSVPHDYNANTIQSDETDISLHKSPRKLHHSVSVESKEGIPDPMKVENSGKVGCSNENGSALPAPINQKGCSSDSIKNFFNCNICNQDFKLGCLLKLHMLSHEQLKFYKCKDCGENFTNDQSLKEHEHIENKHGSTENEILVNNNSEIDDIVNDNSERNHIVNNNGERNDTDIKEEGNCNENNENIIGNGSGIVDATVEDMVDGTIEDMMDGTVEDMVDGYHVHTDLTEMVNSLPCDNCDKVFTSRCSLNRHKHLHSSGNNKLNVEAICEKLYVKSVKNYISGKSFVRNSLPVKRSIKKVAPDKESIKKVAPEEKSIKLSPEKISIKKDVPDKKSAKKDAAHKVYTKEVIPGRTSAIKNNIGKHICMECNKSCLSEYHLKKHSSSHTNQIIVSLPCPECNKTFQYASRLKRHILSHLTERVLSCSQCEKKFRSALHLERHISATHDSSRKRCCFICSECNASFKRNYHLQRHSLSHGDARPYICLVCDKAFKLSYHLKKHTVAMHS